MPYIMYTRSYRRILYVRKEIRNDQNIRYAYRALDIRAIIMIEVDEKSSTLVYKIIKDEFINKIEKVFNKPVRPSLKC